MSNSPTEQESPVEPSVLVVIDSNYFDSDPKLAHEAWAELMKLQAEDVVQTFVPEVVVREVQRHRGTEAEARNRALLEDFRDLHKRLTKAGVALPSIDVQELRQQLRSLAADATLRETFRSELTDLGVDILGLPAVESHEMFEWYVTHSKPFDKDGKGVADYLIWRSAVELASEMLDGQWLALVTDNSTDFAKSGDLHEDLVADTPPGKTIRWFSSPQHLIEGHRTELRKNLKLLRPDSAVNAFQVDGSAEQLALAAAQEYAWRSLLYRDVASLDSDFRSTDIAVEDYDLPTEIENPYFELIEFEPDPEWDEGELLDDTTQLGWLTATGTVVVEGYMNKAAGYSLADSKELRIVDPDHNEHVMLVSVNRRIEVRFQLRVERNESPEVLEAESYRFIAATSEGARGGRLARF